MIKLYQPNLTLDAIEEKNDAKMLHKRLVETRDECFLYFETYCPLFPFSVSLLLFTSLQFIYLEQKKAVTAI